MEHIICRGRRVTEMYQQSCNDYDSYLEFLHRASFPDSQVSHIYLAQLKMSDSGAALHLLIIREFRFCLAGMSGGVCTSIFIQINQTGRSGKASPDG